MDWGKVVKKHYDAGRYNNGDVAVFVLAGMITEQQYEDITGDVYEAA